MKWNRTNALQAVAVTLLTGSSIAALAPAAQSIEPNVSEQKKAQDVKSPSGDLDNLILKTEGNDGVKGRIKNFSGLPVEVRVGSPFAGDAYQLAPGTEVTYYDSSKTDLGAGGEGINLYFQNPGQPNWHRIELSDPDIGRPDTRYQFKDWWFPKHAFISNHRLAWDEGEQHHELSYNRKDNSPTKFWIKREDDGWDGGHETEDTEDWQVFTIHIDNI